IDGVLSSDRSPPYTFRDKRGVETVLTRDLIIVFNGLTQGAIFFILGSGLTLAFGLMRIVNMSHGAFYLLGGYLGLSTLRYTGSWLLALAVAGVSIALLGLLLERS